MGVRPGRARSSSIPDQQIAPEQLGELLVLGGERSAELRDERGVERFARAGVGGLELPFEAGSLQRFDHSAGAYRLKPKVRANKPRIFVTPEIAAALRRAGKDLKVDIGEEEPDEYELFLRKERYDASGRGGGS